MILCIIVSVLHGTLVHQMGINCLGKKRRRENDSKNRSFTKSASHQAPATSNHFTLMNQWKRFLPGILITLAVVVAYANTLRNDFVHDDRIEISDNRYIQKWDQVPKVFVTPAWAFMSQTGRKMESNYYRPIQYLTYAILYHLFGPTAWAFHLFKLLLHLLVCLLFYLLLKQTTSDEGLALIAALLFSVHPINSEAVTWISGITDVLCALFMLIGWILYGKSQKTPSLSILIGFYLVFLGGMLSKETMVMFIPLLFCTEWIQISRFPGWQSWKRYYFPLTGFFLIYLAMRSHAIGGMTTAKQYRYIFLDVSQTALNQLVLLSEYLVKFFWPFPLNAFHVFDPVLHWNDWRVVYAFAIFGGSIIAVWLLKNKMTRSQIVWASWGVLWFLFSLVPVILFFKRIGENVFAERYLYPASLGLCLVVAIGINAQYLKKLSLSGFLLAILLVLGIWRIFSYNRIWKNDLIFYQNTSKISPRAQLIWTNLGGEYLALGRREEAIKAFQTSISIQPTAPALGNLAMLCRLNGDFKKAIPLYQQAIRLDPDTFVFYSGLADVYRMVNNPSGVAENLRRYVEFDPASSAIWFNLADALLAIGKSEEAVAAYDKARQLSPGEAARAYLGMSNSYRNLNQKEKSDQMMKLYLSSFK